MPRGRKSIGAAPMTAAERQSLERERNRRARLAVTALGNFAFNAVDWGERRELNYTEIMNALFLLSKWATDGDQAIEEWRLTVPPERYPYVEMVFDRFGIPISLDRAPSGVRSA